MSAGQGPGRGGDDQVAGHRAGRGQAGQGGGERLAGHEHHVVAEQEAAPQAGAEREQAQGEADGGADEAGCEAGAAGTQSAQPSLRRV